MVQLIHNFILVYFYSIIYTNLINILLWISMQYYTLTNHMLISTNAYSAVVGPEELETLSSIEKPTASSSLRELALTYPQAKSYLKDKVKELKQQRALLIDKEWEIKKTVDGLTGTTNGKEDMLYLLLEVYVVWPKKALEHEIAQCEKILWNIDMQKSVGTGGVNIDKARAVPISDFVEFSRSGFAKCIWHSEKSASMKYYKRDNKVKCFGCSKGGDVIDVVQQLDGISFLEAVKKLT